MRRVIHAWRLLVEFSRYAVVNQALWVVPFIMLLLSIAGLVGVVQTVVPFTLYTLF